MPFDVGVLEAGEPAPHRLDLPSLDHGRPVGRDQLGRHVDVAGGLGVRDRPSDQAVLAVPAPGAPMQLRDQLRLTAGELGAQVLGEQVVVAPGQPLLVEGNDEQVAALQLPQRRLRVAVAGAGQGGAQRGGQLLQDAGVEQEADHLIGLASQDVLAEEVGDVPAGAREAIHELLGVGAVAQRQRGQIQPGGSRSARKPMAVWQRRWVTR